ncbi:hypothetical protein PT974_01090 [Cladobotryum mycophilum]|uniref:RRM domain-containing protein n=1 Tax=Cladobotryum mycophilum TaxID=491253 RepID=A0ABR0T2N2_9HYPO
MIRPPWNRQANTLLARIGGSSRQISSQLPFQPSLPRLEPNETKSSSEGGGNDYGLPNKSQLAKARRELLKIDRPRPRPGWRSESKSESRATTKKEPRHSPLKEKRPSRPIHERNQQGRGSRNPVQEVKATKESDGKEQKSADNEKRRNTLTKENTPVVWPLLKRKPQQQHNVPGLKNRGGPLGHGVGKLGLSPDRYQLTTPNDSNPPQPSTGNESRLMLVIDSLSPNLNPSDFYRIAPTDLSDWSSVIKQVQQKRHRTTFEPLGQYFVTFSSSEAALAYRDKLYRLHKLGGLKLKSATGLWESSVPVNLKAKLMGISPDAAKLESNTTTVLPDEGSSTSEPSPTTSAGGGDELITLVNSFTLAPASLSPIQIERKRVAISHSWVRNLAQIVEPLGYGEKPSILLLDVYPPTLTAKHLFEFIRTDGHTRGLRWQVAMPHHLKPAPTLADEEASDENEEVDIQGEQDEVTEENKPSFLYKDHDTWEKLKGRFVLVCADLSEAKRFQRSWNNRALTTSRPRVGRFIVHASIINW